MAKAKRRNHNSDRKPPWYIKYGPTSDVVAGSSVDIEDHFGKSSVIVTEWANGEGFDVLLDCEKQPQQRLEISWQEWGALKIAVLAMKAKSHELTNAAIEKSQANLRSP